MEEGQRIYCHTSMNGFFNTQIFTRGNYYGIKKILQSGSLIIRTDSGTEALIRRDKFTRNFSTDLRVSSETYYMSRHKMI